MISFVYFDVGGVAILDFSGTDKWDRLKQGIGVDRENAEAFGTVWNRHRDRICLDYDVDLLLPELAREVGLAFREGYSLLGDFVDRFEPNPTIQPVIGEIKRRCRVGLLTNMYPRMYGEILKRDILPHMNWDDVVDSSIVGFQKPDTAIFALAQDHTGVPAHEILFVDNSPEHTAVADEVGWKTFLYDPSRPGDSSRVLSEFMAEM